MTLEEIKEFEESQAFTSVLKKGHHSAGTGAARYPRNTCGCSPETDGGYAYRDRAFERTNSSQRLLRVRFYHQNRIYRKYRDKEVFNCHSHGSSPTTRQRISSELPDGFKLISRGRTVKLKLPDGDCIEVPTTRPVIIDYGAIKGFLEIRTSSGKILDYRISKDEEGGE